MASSLSRPLDASYRLQLTPTFGFADVVALLEPIAALGVSHLYLSPVAEAVTGSPHGYDVVDHRRIRAEFGGRDGLFALLDAAHHHDLGVVIDHVPNHVSVAAPELNPRWWQLLGEGPDSDADRWFDVDWELTDGSVIVPRLGAPLVDVLAEGGLTVGTGALGPELRYGSLRLPVRNGTEALPMEELLAAQHYRLQYWRRPERNVRRFFTIDDLVAVRVESPEVAEAVDTIPRLLCEHPAFDGVRVDHVDGLGEPGRYLERLRATLDDRWLLVEKILGPEERLPASWPVDGTTGYEHITMSEHLMLDPDGEAPLDDWWQALVASGSGENTASFHALESEARREVLAGGLRPDLDRLVRRIGSRVGAHPESAAEAVVELTLALDRYRTYLPHDGESRAVLGEARNRAIARRPDLAHDLERFVELIENDAEVRVCWQQLTGPVMAKGAEDRAFYRHVRLAALSEVGGAPGAWTLGVEAFHRHQLAVQTGWPTTMLASTTHDTKRSAAVRARSLALAADAASWVATEQGWLDTHAELVADLRPADVSLALQTVVTAPPLDTGRLSAYLVKATREAELRTSWIAPDDRYERALDALAVALVGELADDRSRLARWADRLAVEGSAIGRRLLALQLTCPGVPDLYQGAPFELTSLVDPDNRRPPNWEQWRAAVLGGGTLRSGGPTEADLAAMALARRLLAMRGRHRGAFGPSASYLPLEVTGPGAEHVVAFGRGDGAQVTVVTIVIREQGRSALDDVVVSLPPGSWRHVAADREGDLAGDVGIAASCIDGLAVLERVD